MTIRVLSWNMAMFERSAEAPERWSIHSTEEAVRQVILGIDPDVVALQELPGMVPFVGTLDMVKSNPRTHSGNLATLATHEMFRPKPVFGSVASCAILCHFPTAKLTVANVHFQSGKAAAEDRLAQLETVMKATNGKRVLVIGDTNTRVGELGSIAELGLITPDLPSPTWDGRRNQFRGGTRPFSAYFTRFFHTSDLEIETIEVLTEPFRAEGYQFHLSDHFPLVVNIATN